ncbi:fascin domain-containing protein [Micromonospora sp. I033]
MNKLFSLKKPRAAIIAAVIAPVAMLLALFPAPASAATPKPSGASTVQGCSTPIWAAANSSFVSANLTLPPDYPLQARAPSQGSWETFSLVPVNGKYAIYSYAANRYVTANISGAGNGALQAKANSVGAWELFTINLWDDTLYYIKASANGKYVTANVSGTGNGALQAKADGVGSWELFDFNLCAFS